MANPHRVESFNTSSGARVFRLPLEAFPGFWAYAYLVLVKDYCILIDTGSGNQSSVTCLEQGFEQVGKIIRRQIDSQDLTHILVTHGHIDHFGGLVFLRNRSRAQIGVHELDWHTLTHHEERLALLSYRLDIFLREAGVASELRNQLLTMYRFTKAIYHSVSVDFTYEAAGMHVGPLEMIHLPGHCPGHVAIRLDEYVFSGDHVLEDVIPHQAPESLIPYMGLEHYLDSLQLLERWAVGAKSILSGHNKTIQDLPARTAAIRHSLASRLHLMLEFLDEPHDISEITHHLYGGINGYNALLVLEKTGAFVEYLYQQGFLEIVNVHQLENSGQPITLLYHRLRFPESELLIKERTYVLV